MVIRDSPANGVAWRVESRELVVLAEHPLLTHFDGILGGGAGKTFSGAGPDRFTRIGFGNPVTFKTVAALGDNFDINTMPTLCAWNGMVGVTCTRVPSFVLPVLFTCADLFCSLVLFVLIRILSLSGS